MCINALDDGHVLKFHDGLESFKVMHQTGHKHYLLAADNAHLDVLVLQLLAHKVALQHADLSRIHPLLHSEREVNIALSPHLPLQQGETSYLVVDCLGLQSPTADHPFPFLVLYHHAHCLGAVDVEGGPIDNIHWEYEWIA